MHMVNTADKKATILLTGATGFVGGELLARLGEGSPLRCLVRDASRLHSGAESVEADLSDAGSLRPALEKIEEVFYLVHSMEPGADGFAERDREAAENYARVAAECGVRRTIYLGGIAPGDGQSEHLDSRLEVERVLAEATPEFVGLRTSMIVGARSASFRTLVQLVDRLPVLALPSWRDTCTQPIAISDVVACLDAARSVPPGTYDVAGPDTLSLEAITEVVSDLLGQSRRSFPLPFTSSRLEAALSAAVTGEDRELLEPLMAGLQLDLLTSDNAAKSVFGVDPTPFRNAAADAIAQMDVASPAA